MPSCSKCGSPSIEHVRYNGCDLCREHFLEFVERRFKAEFRKQTDLNGKKVVAVALSGGKDSSVAVYLTHQILKERRGVEVVAITVDEGIAGYRPGTIGKAARLAESLGMRHVIISLEEELGVTMDEMACQGEKGACAYCGVLRRKCLNLAAKRVEADIIVTGHNLDDMAQSILMNFMRGDTERLARLGPHDRVQPGLVPRVEPLRQVPEKESFLYALLRELPFSDDECPYANEALRNEFRALIDDMESRHPGTRHSILASYDSIRPALHATFPTAGLSLCACGEPCHGGKCMACRMLDAFRER
ncbi:MAG: TIGR00269 family protein [Methanomassiliicoccales archaeon]